MTNNMENKDDKNSARKPFDPLEGCAWPDPDPSHATLLQVNDVSLLSSTRVHRIVFPRTEEDVIRILQQALTEHKHVSIRGTKHSMGGHCMVENGYVMDTAYLNEMQYNEKEETITVGPGCTWADVIQLLNKYGKSPKVMQSYCSFSVGGTLAVNAHGITSDETLASCVRSFRLVRYNGKDVEVTTCMHPKDNSSSSLSEAEELFGLALGGYGLFGVITQVTLEVADNVDLEMESLTALSLRSDTDDSSCQFVRVWDACRADKDTVDIKLARLDILTLNTASLYVFRKGFGRTISDLSMQPRQLSSSGRLLYKWALPLLKDVRHSREESSGQAVDMKSPRKTRNDLLWESALPLAKLYSPLVVLNDTFVLQEYFVPHDCFGEWIDAARPIFKDIDEYQRKGSIDEVGGEAVAAQSLTLLNTTIRYVEEDSRTFLRYSPREGGVFAFVLYFRIKRTPEVEHDLGVFHNRLAEAAVALGGTFYLPYRRCYDKDLLLWAYPQMEIFPAKKEKYDPLCMFSSQWFEHYVLPLCSTSYQTGFSGTETGLSLRKALILRKASTVSCEAEFMQWLPRINDPLLERRTNSYRTLLKDKYLRKRFSEEFLVNIFNIADPSEIMRVMSNAAWDPRNEDDLAIYSVLREHFHGSSSAKPVKALRQGWRALRQLSHQKTELSDETSIILHRLGKFGRIRGYLSIGDHGKTVHNFRKIGLVDPSGESQVIVANNFNPHEDEVSLQAVLERGSMHPIGDKQIQFDYLVDDAEVAFKEISSASMDLVTLNQGLHHFPPQKLYRFLCEVKRVLCPGGVFIFREHDLDLQRRASASATSAPVAMLDLAHSIFNAVTGVSEYEEANEIRAFRPLSEWRSMMEKMGLVDSMLYGLEEGDSTCDFMLCFIKGDVHRYPLSSMPPASVENSFDKEEPPMMATIRALLAQVPAAVTGGVETIIEKLLQMLPAFLETLSRFLLIGIPKAVIDDEQRRQNRGPGGISHWELLSAESITEFAALAESFLRTKLERVTEIGDGAKDLLRDIHIRETSNIAGLLTMPELFLVLPLLKRKHTLYPDRVGEVEKMFVGFVETMFPMLLQVGDSGAETITTSESSTTAMMAMSVEDSGLYREHSVERTIAPDGPVDKKDVLHVITYLSQQIPGLLDPAVMLSESGFTLSQQSALVGTLAAKDLSAFAENVASYHDQQSWQQLRWMLVGDTSNTVQVESVAKSRDLPTKELLFSKELNHPWHRTLKVFLKGPRVKLKQHALFGLRVLDLGDLISLYKEAKENTSNEQTTLDRDNNGLRYSETNALSHFLSNLARTGEVKETRIQFNGSINYDLFDVAEVVKAEFGYKSLTSSLTDVTNEMKALHVDVHVRKDSSAPPGWLPIREDILTGFRNKGGAAMVRDSLRKVVVGTGSLGMAGNNILKLSYLPLQTAGMSSQQLEAADQLCAYTEQRRLISPDLHPNDGHYTWFKLSEWMQVEMMELFTKSLDHTPWYHFPFFEFLSTYFRILFQECEIVRSEHGLLEAYGSMAFATDFVPGIVMSFLFAQMQLLSIPLQLSLPTYNPDIMTEDILMTACLIDMNDGESVLQFFQNVVDERIRNATLLSTTRSDDAVTTGLYRITIPTFKPMGEILVKVGDRLPSARVLQISNQKVVQVLLSVEGLDLVEPFVKDIDSMDGLQVMFQYQYPNGESLVQLSAKVHVTSLLLLSRFVARLDSRVQVKQIYDFWSG